MKGLGRSMKKRFVAKTDHDEDEKGDAKMARLSSRLSALLGCAIMTSACTTTDTLTPLADIGESQQHIASSPITQPDAERMAETESRRPFPAQSRGSELANAYQEPPAGTSTTSMEAQAEAIERGERSPSASKPLEAEPPVVSNAQAEEEDMGTTPRREKAHVSPSEAPAPAEQQTATIQRGNTVRFLPIIGAPVEAVTPLSRQLGNEARSHGLAIKASNDASSDYILKGYLSAYKDKDKVTVTYVWDVLDNGGNRLHRIQGEKTVPAGGTDPWAGVPASTMQDIASSTITEFSSWRTSEGG